jgi:methionine synthase I (cobalamin-dependent)/5,10-methylenetetrahydrofolate reductase
MSNSIMQELGCSVLIGSGAIGTCLRQASGIGDEPVELLNLRQPETVRSLHAAYRSAGSRILVTNTFASNAIFFGDAGIGELCGQANRAGVALAREAGGSQCLIWASMGPLGLGLRLDDYPADALFGVYRSQCEALGEADALLLETFVDLREARAALQAAAETGLPVIFQIGNTGGGAQRWERVDQLLAEAHRVGVTAVGTNCYHPDEIVRVASYIGARTDLPLTASPNAGHPRIERGLVKYEFTPDDFAATAMALADAGAAVIGGCCGTTPDHIRRMASVLGRRAVLSRTRVSISPERAPVLPERPDITANPIRSMIKSNRFLISVEIRADRTKSLGEIVQGAAKAAAAGADMFNVPDNPGATVGRDAMVTAARLQDALQVPSICHLGVTQSNLMRLHSTLIGCWDSGLRGLLAITGDAPSMGHLGNLAHRVVDMRSSVELLRLIRGLRDGKIINGEGLADPPDFCAGCAVGRPIPAQIRWLRTKIEAGAEFVFTQPVFTLDDYKKLRDALAGLPIRIFPGIMPLVSHRSAEFLASGRIPGIVVPEDVVTSFVQYESSADQRRFGLDQAGELAAGIAADASGLYLIMPFGKNCYEDTAQIVRSVQSRR